MTRRKYTLEFKKEAATLVLEQGYTQAKAAEVLGVNNKNISRWVNLVTGKKQETSTIGQTTTPELEEIKRLRKENERLKMEREILKKAAAFFANEKP